MYLLEADTNSTPSSVDHCTFQFMLSVFNSELFVLTLERVEFKFFISSKGVVLNP